MASSASRSSTIESEVANDHGYQRRVMIWCTPRSTSTILSKCLSFVPESQVVFEPYYYCFEALEKLKTLAGRTVTDPASTSGYDDVLACDWQTTADTIIGEDCQGRVDFDLLKYHHVKRMLDKPDPSKNNIFVKDLACTIDGHYDALPDISSGYKFCFLLRHPTKVFASWRKIMINPIRQETTLEHFEAENSKESFHMLRDLPPELAPPGLFFKELYDLWVHVRKHYDPNPVVLDGDDLATDPARMLPLFCRAVGIPFSGSLLEWDGSPDVTKEWISPFSPLTDFKISRIYFDRAFKSTQFLPPTALPPDEDITPDVRECVQRTLPYYQEMHDHRIRL